MAERPREHCGEQDHDEQGDGVLGDHEGSPLRADRTALRRAARAVPGLSRLLGPGAALIAATRSRGMEARGPPFGDQRKEPGGPWSPSSGPSPLSPARAVQVRRRGGVRARAAAGGDRALSRTQAREPGQGRGGGQDQAGAAATRPGRPITASGILAYQRGGQLPVAASAQARTTPMSVAGQAWGRWGMAQMARFRQPGVRGDGVHEHAGGDCGEVEGPGNEGRGGRARPGRYRGRRRPGRRRRGWRLPGRR